MHFQVHVQVYLKVCLRVQCTLLVSKGVTLLSYRVSGIGYVVSGKSVYQLLKVYFEVQSELECLV